MDYMPCKHLQKCLLPIGYSTKGFIYIQELPQAFLTQTLHFYFFTLQDGVSKLKILSQGIGKSLPILKKNIEFVGIQKIRIQNQFGIIVLNVTMGESKILKEHSYHPIDSLCSLQVSSFNLNTLFFCTLTFCYFAVKPY